MVRDDLAAAIEARQAGRIGEAERIGGELAAKLPNEPAIHRFLGEIALQRRDAGTAARRYQAAADLAPRDATVRREAGIAWRAAGNLARAIGHFREAIALDPADPENHGCLFGCLIQSGASDAAMACVQEWYDAVPSADAANNFGKLLLEREQPGAARTWLDQALTLDPGHRDAHGNLADALQALGDWDAALAAYERLLKLDPNASAAHVNMGVIHIETRNWREARKCFEKALIADPRDAEANANMGLIHLKEGRLAEAEAACRRAIAEKPDSLPGWVNLTSTELEMGHLMAAERAAARANAIGGGRPIAAAARAVVLRHLGRTGEALSLLRAAVVSETATTAEHEAMLHTLPFAPATTPADIRAAAAQWHAAQAPAAPAPGPAGPFREKTTLRVGYLSPDFRRHAAAYFLEPLIAGHDPASVTAVCYHAHPVEDDVTRRIKAASEWRDVWSLDDGALADLVRQDGIDILIDCAGYTDNNRLGAMATRPAPLQGTLLLGGGTTTGLSFIDFIVGDDAIAPPGSESDYSERIARVPHALAPFRFDPDWPEVAPEPPARPVFGCFANPVRFDRGHLRLWARILERCPKAALRLQNAAFDDPETADYWRGRLADAGIEGPVELVGGTDMTRGYASVSVVLDTYPMTGATTTLIALWMGTPVVTLAGRYSWQRFGQSALAGAGYSEFVATDPESYVGLAADVAGDRARLRAFRAEVRGRLGGSALNDGRAAARALETALHRLWRNGCSGIRDDGDGN